MWIITVKGTELHRVLFIYGCHFPPDTHLSLLFFLLLFYLVLVIYVTISKDSEWDCGARKEADNVWQQFGLPLLAFTQKAGFRHFGFTFQIRKLLPLTPMSVCSFYSLVQYFSALFSHDCTHVFLPWDTLSKHLKFFLSAYNKNKLNCLLKIQNTSISATILHLHSFG